MFGINNNNKHFDSSKNTLPDNWINSNANGYYNREYWKRCQYDYGTNNPTKRNADKWYPMATEGNKWTKGCNMIKSEFPFDQSFTNHQPYNQINKSLNASSYNQTQYSQNDIPKTDDIAIVYRMPNREMNCENIVDLKLPVGSTKEQYLSNFSPEFIYFNRYQCATSPIYDTGSGNAIDNKRQTQFTPSDQTSLTKRGIKNYLLAQQLVNENKLENDKQSFKFPMNVVGRTAYPFRNNQTVYHTPGVQGIATQDITKGYFRGDD